MEKVYKNILETIGKTPMVQIHKLSPNPYVRILAKLEAFNPMSSVKDRAAVAMIEAGEQTGKIDGSTVIIEPTSGNTGIGLALVCAVKGYQLKLTMPETMSIERRQLLKILGADVVLTDGNLGMQGAIDKAHELSKEFPKAFIPQQFNNPANPDIHQKTTGQEIWYDTDGHVDVFISGVGTGGTLTGVARALKDKNPDVQIVAIEPDNSEVLAGQHPGPHKIQGIGAGFIPEVLDMNLVDEIISVTDEDAAEVTKRLAKEEGIFAGISSGAAMWAAMRIAKRPDMKDKTIVVLLPDTGERYLSSWMYKDELKG